MAAPADEPDEASPPSPYLDALLTKPARSGRTGQRPFGSLGDQIEVDKYDEQLADKVEDLKALFRGAIPPDVVDRAKIFASPAREFRHRAGPLAVRRPCAERQAEGVSLELSMWDPKAEEHSLINPTEVPIFSRPISVAMEVLRTLPIRVDPELGEGNDEQEWTCLDLADASKPTAWGRVIGHGLRSAQFHSTLSGELIVCLAYHDVRLRDLKRGQPLPEEDDAAFENSTQGKRWMAAAQELRSFLLQAMEAADVKGAKVDVVGRWKRRRLAVERDFVQEAFELEDGRKLVYKQPEGQFSNPNLPCEVHCLNWLCLQAKEARKDASAGRRGAGRLLELHCGGGNNTVALAPLFESVRAVEINRTLAQAAEDNLTANNITNAKIFRMSSESIDESIFAGCDVILVDPPRAGLDATARQCVAKFDQILYISCNPLALKGDIKSLGEGFEVVALAIFDMFPYTTHAAAWTNDAGFWFCDGLMQSARSARSALSASAAGVCATIAQQQTVEVSRAFRHRSTSICLWEGQWLICNLQEVEGLGDWLEKLSLSQYALAAREWCSGMGAATVEEIEENWEEFSDAMNLKFLERRRLKLCAAPVSEAATPVARDRADAEEEPEEFQRHWVPDDLSTSLEAERPFVMSSCSSKRGELHSFGDPDNPYTILKELGHGMTATVYKCRRDDQIFAVKAIGLSRLQMQRDKEKALERLRREPGTDSAEAALMHTENWGSIEEVVNAPVENVAGDATWPSVLCMWLTLPLNLIQGCIGGLCRFAMAFFVLGCYCCRCIPGWICCAAMASVKCGRPCILAPSWWRYVLGGFIALLANSRSRLALFIWEWEAFGKGDHYWHGEGYWSVTYEECSTITKSQQKRRSAFACIEACVPDLFASNILLFLPTGGPESEWAAIRKVLHAAMLDRGAYHYTERLQKLSSQLTAEWPEPKLTDFDDTEKLRLMVVKCIFFMIFGIWLDDNDALILRKWRDYAVFFVLPRLIHRFIFNFAIGRVKQLRVDTVGVIEKHGLQQMFVDMNKNLPEKYRRPTDVKLCDEIMLQSCN
ncbi:trmA, partial [Symbiodinium necroappetens]